MKEQLILPKAPIGRGISVNANSLESSSVVSPDGAVRAKSVSMMPRQRQPRWHPLAEEEWDAIKPDFEELYVTKDLPLKDVMLLLGMNGFIASSVANLVSSLLN